MRSLWTANFIYKNADVSIFIAEVDMPAVIYTVATGGTAINTLPQITTDASGMASFYVDTVDYDLDQRFTIKVKKIGQVYTFQLTNVSIFDIIAYADTKQALSEKDIAGGYTGRDADNDTTTTADVADYGGAFVNYIPPTGSAGAIRLAADTNATTPGKRLYSYANAVWSYVDLT